MTPGRNFTAPIATLPPCCTAALLYSYSSKHSCDNTLLRDPDRGGVPSIRYRNKAPPYTRDKISPAPHSQREVIPLEKSPENFYYTVLLSLYLIQNIVRPDLLRVLGIFFSILFISKFSVGAPLSIYKQIDPPRECSDIVSWRFVVARA